MGANYPERGPLHDDQQEHAVELKVRRRLISSAGYHAVSRPGR